MIKVKTVQFILWSTLRSSIILLYSMQLAIRGKLFLGFSVVVLLCLSALWFATHSWNRLIRDALSIVEYELPGVALILNADRDAYQSNLGISFALEEVLEAVEETERSIRRSSRNRSLRSRTTAIKFAKGSTSSSSFSLVALTSSLWTMVPAILVRASR